MRIAAAVVLASCASPPAQQPPPPPAPAPTAPANHPQPPQVEPDDLVVPAAEVVAPDVTIDLPTPPSFDLPAVGSDGSHTVRELRVAGAPLAGTTVVVKGVITWAYDCVLDIRKPGEPDRAAQQRIDADPTLCERAKFHIGDTASAPDEKSLWVVDVPRTYNKLELKMIAPADRTAPDRCEPDERDPKQRVCPPYRAGDEVIILGTFAYASPHKEHNSDGLLVYRAMANLTQHWSTPDTPLAAPAAPAQPHALPSVPAVQPNAHPMRPITDPQIVATSLQAVNAGNQAMANHQASAAIAAFRDAVTAWDGDHLAWYGLGGANAFAGDWAASRDAFERAVRLRPDIAMYQQWYGVAVYEAIAKAQDLDQVPPNAFDAAYVHLQQALQLEPHLWRALYFAGKIERAAGAAKAAAEHLGAAIRANPREPGPYIALAELYRHWDYTGEAIAVATQATRSLADPKLASDAWFELGMAYDEAGNDPKAIEAFTNGLASAAHRAMFLFARGRAYFHVADYANARRDLTGFLAEPDAKSVEWQIKAARQLLGRAGKRR